jgi:hypothetical protein
MPQTPSTDTDHSDEEPHHGDPWIVAMEPKAPEGISKPAAKIHSPKVLPEDLETSEGGKGLVTELDPEISVDTAGQIALS